MEIKGELYAHPLEVTFTTKDGRTFPIQIEPKAIFEIHDLTVRRPPAWEVVLLDREGQKLFTAGPDQLVYRESPSPLRVELPLPPRLPRAYAAELRLRGGRGERRERILFSYCRLWGRVTDFAGRPPARPAYVFCESAMNEFVAGARCDPEGYYELFLPPRRYHTVWAADEGFGHTTLECYAYNFPLAEDREWTFRIGQLELYRLSATVTAERTVLAEFTLFSVHHFLNRLQERRAAGEALRDAEAVADLRFYPELTPQQIALYVDESPVEVWTVERRWGSLQLYGEPSGRRPYWLVEGPLPKGIPKGPHRVRVVVRVPLEEGEEEWGEASYHCLDVW